MNPFKNGNVAKSEELNLAITAVLVTKKVAEI